MDSTPSFTASQVLLNCSYPEKSALIRGLLDAVDQSNFYQQNPGVTRAQVEEAVFKRESEHPTRVAARTACPHARIPGLKGVGAAVAISKSPVSWGDESVDIAVLLLFPAENPPAALKLLANVARLGDSALHSTLCSATSGDSAFAQLNNLLFNVSAPLLARDVMRAPHCFLTPDTPITQVVRKMTEFNLDAMGIVNPDGTMAGEVTSDALFMLGMPDFFSQLKSVSFIKEFDPFHQYFEREIHQNAGEVMSRDIAVVEGDATIIEVIFLLAVKRYAKVYVVRGGKMVGIIDRARVLNEILHV